MMKSFSLSLMIFALVGCADPLAMLDSEMARYGYIRYTTPMASAGTGTLIGGSPAAMELVAHPSTCFPVIEATDADHKIRFRDDTTLPFKSVHFFVNTDLKVNVLKVMAAGAPSIKAGLKLNDAATMELEFQGVHVEYIDSVKLVDYYRNQMSSTCRQYLDKVGFVIQAIVTDSMRFALYRSDGGQIQLTLDNINQYLDISVDTQWQIDQKASLVITTPKYIGYQLGQLRERDKGLSLRRASKVILNKWIWDDIGIFPDFVQNQ